jgi:hypothetical protein
VRPVLVCTRPVASPKPVPPVTSGPMGGHAAVGANHAGRLACTYDARSTWLVGTAT